MLVLTRAVGESIIIDKNITVTVLGLRGKQIRIGIAAPADVSVNREEIQDLIDRKEQTSTLSSN